MALSVEEWENKLEQAGVFGDQAGLVELYKSAPSGAPSISVLGSWLESNGINIKGVR